MVCLGCICLPLPAMIALLLSVLKPILPPAVFSAIESGISKVQAKVLALVAWALAAVGIKSKLSGDSDSDADGCKSAAAKTDSNSAEDKKEESAEPKEGEVTTVTSLQAFENIIGKGGKPVIVDFTAEWCAPCKAIKPKFKDLAQRKPEITFLAVDVDRSQDVAQKYNVMCMPTFIGFNSNGGYVDRIEGAVPAKLFDLVKQVMEQ